MNPNTTTAAKPSGSVKSDDPRAFTEMAEKGTTQAREAYGKMSAAATEASDLIKASSSTALSGIQDYNNKFLEFAHANSNASYEYQGKQLMELAQKVALATVEPLKAGVAKAFNQAR
jgi:hypothetical protein